MSQVTDTVPAEAPASLFAGHDVPRDLHAPHVEQYFGPWAIKEDIFRAAFERFSRTDLRAHVVVQQARAEERDARREGLAPKADGEGVDPPPRPTNYPVTETGIAVLALTGPLMKTVGSLEEGTSTVMFRRSLRNAMNNPAISGIMIVIDSPGGTVAGTFELAEDIAAAAAKKPTHAYIQDLGCSAAYWAASQATVISSNVMGIVGSIGTFMPVYDFSGWAEQQGIRVEIVKEGQFKGAGTPGTKITDEQLAEWQRTVTALNEQFVGHVARGRQISEDKAKKLNDGRVHVGAAAKSMGLVDYVETFEQSMKRMESKTRKGGAKAEDAAPAPAAEQTNEGAGASAGPVAAEAEAPPPASNGPGASEDSLMANPTTTTAPASQQAAADTGPKPATIAELKAAFPTDPAYALEAAEKAFTLVEAKAGYADVLAKRLDASAKENEQLKASAAQKPAETKAEEPAAKKPGVKPVESKPAEGKSAGGASLDAKSEFTSRVSALVKDGKSRADAVSQVAREDPALHQQMIDQANRK